MTRGNRKLLQRGALGAVSVGIIVATFAFFLPSIANYADVWKVVQGMSWQWIVALIVVTAINLATFAPPWHDRAAGARLHQSDGGHAGVHRAHALLPGRRRGRNRPASYGITRRWGFPARDIARARDAHQASGTSS